MPIWPSSWNWKIVTGTCFLGAVVGVAFGTWWRWRVALPPHGARPVNSAEILVERSSDGLEFLLLYGLLGASVALTLMAPPLIVASLFQIREMSRQAQLKSHRAMQESFPAASRRAKASPADSDSARAGLPRGAPS